MATNLEIGCLGYISPYPRVEAVTRTKYMLSMYLNSWTEAEKLKYLSSWSTSLSKFIAAAPKNSILIVYVINRRICL